MFRTELTIEPAARQLPRTARVLTMGSCFADSMGRRLADSKVATLVNPLGTVFQPLALGKLLRAALGEDVDWQQHVVEARGRWQSYDLHSSIGAASPVELLQTIAEQVYNVGTFLRNADVVVLTLGTAWAYRLRETGELVSNCHKMPAELFEKELLTADEIINALAETHAYLRRINPKLRFILTVSPVRHLKDTLPLNAVSKSVLRVASYYLSELLPDVAYFPAFELLMDDLRDYRFYGADMLHPTEVAEDYVWEKFARTYFDADFGRFRKEWTGVRQALAHRPLYAGAPEHRSFLESTGGRLERLAGQDVDVGAELAEVRARLAALPVPVLPMAMPETEDAEDGEERIDIGEAGAEATKAAPATVPANIRNANARAASSLALESAAAALPELTEANAAETASAEGRPGRLSPEEFRQQRANRERGGRNDRRKGRHGEPKLSPAEELAALESGTPQPLVPLVAPLLPEAAEASLVEVSPMAAILEAGTDAGDTTKKKKRRSRGGAKRTARKHAALLAEAGGLASPVVAGAGDEHPATPAAPMAPAAPAETLPATEGAGPRKSSVITKSVPVKRGGRNQRGKLWAVPEGGATAAEPVAGQPAPMPEATPPMPAREARQPVPALPIAAEASAPTLAETVLGLKSKPKVNWDEVRPAAPAPVAAPAAVPTAPVAVPTAAPAPVAKANPSRNKKKARPTPVVAASVVTPVADAPVVATAPVVLPEAPPVAAAPTSKPTATAKKPAAKKAGTSGKPTPANAVAAPVVAPTPVVPTPAALETVAAKALPAKKPTASKAPPAAKPAAKPTAAAPAKGAAKAKPKPTPAATPAPEAVTKPVPAAAKKKAAAPAAPKPKSPPKKTAAVSKPAK